MLTKPHLVSTMFFRSLMYFLRSTHCPDIQLEHDTPLVLGRGPLTTITDSRLSRNHVEVHLSGREIILKQLGHNHSIVLEKPLIKGEQRKLNPGETFRLLNNQYEFKFIENIPSNNELVMGNAVRPSSSIVSSSHWSQGLLASMHNPDLVIHSDDCLVTIKDKYPKAKYHYLVLPKKKISSLHSLERQDLGLLQKMDKEASRIVSIHPQSQFKFGYHAIPSMSHLHLHVISQDLDSPCMKHKKHWNSFTTPYFVPSNDVIQELRNKGFVKKPEKEIVKDWLNTALKCHKCEYVPKHFPDLKEHIKSHS